MWWADGVRFACVECGRCCVRKVPNASAPLLKKEILEMVLALKQEHVPNCCQESALCKNLAIVD
eukprot:3188766-Amphidinium_carterae.2